MWKGNGGKRERERKRIEGEREKGKREKTSHISLCWATLKPLVISGLKKRYGRCEGTS